MTDKSSPPPIPPTAAEKLETLFQDQALRNAERRKNASTFSQFANAEANADAGRYAQINKAAVVGAKAVPDYPNQPTNSFSNQAAVVGPEEPLGFDVNETPIVGESWEVEASLERSADQSGLPSHADGPSVEAGSSVDLISNVERPPIPYPNKQPAETSQQDRPSQQFCAVEGSRDDPIVCRLRRANRP
jgi:hypothetical protein